MDVWQTAEIMTKQMFITRQTEDSYCTVQCVEWHIRHSPQLWQHMKPLLCCFSKEERQSNMEFQFRDVMTLSCSTGCLIKTTELRSLNGCLIKTLAIFAMRGQDTMETIAPGQAGSQMCVRLRKLFVFPQCNSCIVCNILCRSFFLPSFVVSHGLMIVFLPSRCCRRPTRQTMTSSTPSWPEVIQCQTHLSGLPLQVIVGSVRTLRPTRWTVLSVLRALLRMLTFFLPGQKPRQPWRPTPVLISVSQQQKPNTLVHCMGLKYIFVLTKILFIR